MSGYKETFERKEVKYLLGWKQYEALRRRLSPYVEEDVYGKTQILNIYFDTPDFRLVRRSLEKPAYKEKLRLRTYRIPDDDTTPATSCRKGTSTGCLTGFTARTPQGAGRAAASGSGFRQPARSADGTEAIFTR